MPTNIRVRESTENVPSSRRVRDVADTIQYLDPNENPFVLLSKASGSRTVMNSKFEWIEKELPTKSTQVDTTTGTGTTVQVDDASIFFVNDVVQVLRTTELMRVTAIASPNLTVERGVGSVSTAALADNDDLLIIGTSNAEGGSLGTPRSVQETYPYNYTQIFKLPIGTTNTEAVSENYGGRDQPRLRKEAGIYHMMEIERSFLYGQRNIDTTSTATPVRYSGGFTYWVTTNLQSASGTLTEPEMETFTQTVFQATGAGNTRVLFAAPGVVSIIDQLAAGRLETVPSDKTFGIEVLTWLTSHGRFNIIKHRLLENGPGGTGYGGFALAVDPKKVQYCPLRERDTKLRIDVGTPGDDSWTDEYITEAGFQISNQKVHGILYSVTS